MVLPEADGEGFTGDLQAVHGDFGVIPLASFVDGGGVDILENAHLATHEGLLVGDETAVAEGPGHAVGVCDMDGVIDLGWGGG
ncbi:MAG TPA: hypothetical protein DCY12_01330, partial [Candidatus Atribacteria bacterium]|nr:hypothetical protein [Candidatus Atribacteria bacterium]